MYIVNYVVSYNLVYPLYLKMFAGNRILCCSTEYILS